jgi:putative N6-adenine-specific DNA methylase
MNSSHMPAKRNNTNNKGKYNLTAKTYAGLEPVLVREIQNIGGKNIKEGRRAISFTGDLEIIYRANYYLRTALRILKEIAAFHFRDVDQFYLECKSVNWPEYMNTNQNFIVNSTVVHSKEFRNSMYASLKVKDAVADSFREKRGGRPNVDATHPEIFINVYINKNTCILSMDSSGESLHKRGYRITGGDAPLSEVLAAGMILLSGWKGSSDFIDPMCGSGTLPIEAAMIAKNIPPGKFRKKFAFENWPDFDKILFEKVKKRPMSKPFSNKIYASDISQKSLLRAQTNARRAGVYSTINFKSCNIKDLQTNTSDAVIIINPPYGERLKYQNLKEIYSTIGSTLKHQFAGNSAWVLTTSGEYLKYIGLKHGKKITLYNGAIKCTFSYFPLFEGKRKNTLIDTKSV